MAATNFDEYYDLNMFDWKSTQGIVIDHAAMDDNEFYYIMSGNVYKNEGVASDMDIEKFGLDTSKITLTNFTFKASKVFLSVDYLWIITDNGIAIKIRRDSTDDFMIYDNLDVVSAFTYNEVDWALRTTGDVILRECKDDDVKSKPNELNYGPGYTLTTPQETDPQYLQDDLLPPGSVSYTTVGHWRRMQPIEKIINLSIDPSNGVVYVTNKEGDTFKSNQCSLLTPVNTISINGEHLKLKQLILNTQLTTDVYKIDAGSVPPTSLQSPESSKTFKSSKSSTSLQSPGSSTSLQSPGSSTSLQSPGSSTSLQSPGSSKTFKSSKSSTSLQSPGPQRPIRSSIPRKSLQSASIQAAQGINVSKKLTHIGGAWALTKDGLLYHAETVASTWEPATMNSEGFIPFTVTELFPPTSHGLFALGPGKKLYTAYSVKPKIPSPEAGSPSDGIGLDDSTDIENILNESNEKPNSVLKTPLFDKDGCPIIRKCHSKCTLEKTIVTKLVYGKNGCKKTA